MTRILLSILLVGFAVPGAVAQRSPTAALIDGVELKLERMEDLSADFVHIYEDPLNRTYREEGHLYLRRPRMMRWEYRTPEEYLYVSDGETVYLYVPADEQVNRESVDDSFDDRIPLNVPARPVGAQQGIRKDRAAVAAGQGGRSESAPNVPQARG